LIRDVKFLTGLPDPRDKRYGEDLRVALKKLFEVYHRRADLPKDAFEDDLKKARDQLLQIGKQAPPTQHGQNMAKRFATHGEAYFTFITTANVEPTNNLAEQAIRFVVIDRHVTQGTRGEAGRTFCQRMWTVVATCAQRSCSVWTFVSTAVANWFAGQPAPSLLACGNAATAVVGG
jgi:hypothetical protein